ncbi:MAG: ACP S-malonyltransferase [Holosporaceae bacterium]|jgi:[acyl-carrier-protein] S-malonyltransferase|nr:ACP S-malonyltransferase [Holosporaceae bacterium]
MLFMFPGQGSQKIGMGKDLYDNFPSARSVFQEVDDALEYHLSRLIFDGSAEELRATANVQPALMAVGMACFSVLKNDFSPEILNKVKFLAGHSLGEYTALCVGGVISLADTARLLRVRGQAMAAACPDTGAMAAIIGLEVDVLENLLETENTNESIVQVANDNCYGQVVISGHGKAVEKAMQKSLDMGAKKAILLDVSGPFHSRLMESALDALARAMEPLEFHNPVRPVISNVTAAGESGNFKELLLRQVTSMVRWRESIEFSLEHAVTRLVEIGSGRVLTGLAKRIAPDVECCSLGSPESIEKFASCFC